MSIDTDYDGDKCFPRISYGAAPTRTQGADEPAINQCDGCMAGHIIGQSGLHEHEGRGYMACQAKRYGADDAQPVAIYQAKTKGYTAWTDCSEDAFAHMRNKPMIFETRIVYATRATPADHISQARDAISREQILDLCVEFGPYFINDRDNDLWGLMIHLYGLERTAPEKPAGDVSDI